MIPRYMIRNGRIGVASTVVIVALALVFFHDAGEGVLTAIALFAYVFAFVVAHALDALAERRARKAERATRSEAGASSTPQGPVRPDRASAAPAAPRAS